MVGKSAAGKYVHLNKVEEENEDRNHNHSGKKMKSENKTEEKKLSIGVADWRKKTGPINREVISNCMIMGGGSS